MRSGLKVKAEGVLIQNKVEKDNSKIRGLNSNSF